MARYKITDNQSGRSLVIEGVNPPTEQDAENLFQQAGLRTGTQRVNPLLTKQPSKPLPSYQEWAMSQERAPFSEALSTKGTLGAVTGAVLNPLEQATRFGLGSTQALLETGKALAGDQKAQKTILQGNIPYLPESTEKAFRTSTGQSAMEGIRAGANVAQFLPGVAPTLRGTAGLGAMRGFSGSLGQTRPDQTVGQQLQQVATGTITGAGIETALPLLGRGLQKTTQAIRDITQPLTGRAGQGVETLLPRESARAVELGQKYGVDLPISARRPGAVTEITEATAAKGLFGRPIAERIEKAGETIAEQRSRLRQQAVPQQIDFMETGQRVKQAFEKYVGNFQRKANELYDNIPNLKNTRGTTNETVNFLENIVTAKSRSKVPSRDLGFYREALNNIKDNANLTAEDLRETLKAVGSRLDDNADVIAKADKAALKKFYQTLNTDLENTLKTQGLTKELDQIRNANKFYSENINKINTKLGRDITNMRPEAIMDALVKPNDVTGIKLLKNIIGEESLQPIRDSFNEKIMFSSLDRTGQFIDPLKLKNNMNKYGMSTLKELFTPEQMTNLNQVLQNAEELDELLKIMRKSQKTAEGSQTAFISLFTAGGILSLLNPAVLLPYIGGQFALSRIVENADNIAQAISNTKRNLGIVGTTKEISKGVFRGTSRVAPVFGQYTNIATQGNLNREQ